MRRLEKSGSVPPLLLGRWRIENRHIENIWIKRVSRHQKGGRESGTTISIAQNKPLNRQNSAVNRQKCQKKMSRSIAVSKNNPIFVLRRLWTNIQKQFYSTRFYCLFRAVLSAITTPAHRPLARAVAWGFEAKLLNFTLLCYSRFALRQQRSEPSPLRLQSSLRPSQPHPTRYGARLMRGCVGSQFSTLGGSGQRILVKMADQNTAQNDFWTNCFDFFCGWVRKFIAIIVLYII